MIKNKLFSLIIFSMLFVLSYILIQTIFITSPNMLKFPSFIILLVVLIGSLFIASLSIFLTSIKHLTSRVFFAIFLTIITTLPRLIWVLLIRTTPVSDFMLYHDYAVNGTKGIFNIYHITYTIFPFKFGYPLLLAVEYKLLGTNAFSGMIGNVILSVCLAVLIYWVGYNVFNEKTGRISGILFALWPAQIMYNSVLASEHVFIVFFVLALGLLVKFNKLTLTSKQLYTYCALTGISLTLANFIRPVALILLPVIAVFMFLFVENKAKEYASIRKLQIIGVVVLSFVISFATITLPFSKVIGIPIWKASSGYNLLVGSNYKSSGGYNIEDEGILSEFNFDYDKVHKEATKRALNRIMSHPAQFSMLVEKKYNVLWASEDYGYYWSTLKLDNQNRFSNFIMNSQDKMIGISQVFYIIILILSLLGCINIYKNKVLNSTALILVFLALFAAFTFLEVQPRYHYPAIPIFIILAAYGVECYTNAILKKGL